VGIPPSSQPITIDFGEWDDYNEFFESMAPSSAQGHIDATRRQFTKAIKAFIETWFPANTGDAPGYVGHPEFGDECPECGKPCRYEEDRRCKGDSLKWVCQNQRCVTNIPDDDDDSVSWTEKDVEYFRKTSQARLCPICGETVTVTGITKDGRLIGSCGDAFSLAKWNEVDTVKFDEVTERKAKEV
jgi:hypothetical protein